MRGLVIFTPRKIWNVSTFGISSSRGECFMESPKGFHQQKWHWNSGWLILSFTGVHSHLWFDNASNADFAKIQVLWVGWFLRWWREPISLWSFSAGTRSFIQHTVCDNVLPQHLLIDQFSLGIHKWQVRTGWILSHGAAVIIFHWVSWLRMDKITCFFWDAFFRWQLASLIGFAQKSDDSERTWAVYTHTQKQWLEWKRLIYQIWKVLIIWDEYIWSFGMNIFHIISYHPSIANHLLPCFWCCSLSS